MEREDIGLKPLTFLMDHRRQYPFEKSRYFADSLCSIFLELLIVFGSNR